MTLNVLKSPPTPIVNDELTDCCQLLRARWSTLTTREQQIAYTAAQGYTNHEIAILLHLQEKTVRTHLTRTYTKLKIANRHLLIAAMWSTTLARAFILVHNLGQHQLIPRTGV